MRRLHHSRRDYDMTCKYDAMGNKVVWDDAYGWVAYQTRVQRVIERAESMWFPITFEVTPRIVAPILLLTGWRFDKTWRHAEFGPKSWAYRWAICTFKANILADKWRR